MIPLGTQIPPYGKVVAVGWVGERYYWMVDNKGVISMMPASMIEATLSAETD